MKISPSVLRTIALSAGMAVGLTTVSAENEPAPTGERSPAPPAGEPVPAEPDANGAEARAIFLRHDTDKDGKLSPEEFDKVFAEMRREVKRIPRAGPARVGPARVVPEDPCPFCGRG